MSSISVSCPACAKTYQLQPSAVGKTAKCGCGERFKVERPAAVVVDGVDDEYGLEEPEEPDEPIAAPSYFETFPQSDDSPKASDAAPLEEKPARATTSSALVFLGVCGVIVSGFAALMMALLVLGTIYSMLITPPPNVLVGAAILGMNAFSLLVWYVIYRLGVGLTRCEKSAVQGLLVIYLLIVGALVCLAIATPELLLVAVVGAVITSVVFLPPIVVGFANWSHLWDAE